MQFFIGVIVGFVMCVLWTKKVETDYINKVETDYIRDVYRRGYQQGRKDMRLNHYDKYDEAGSSTER